MQVHEAGRAVNLTSTNNVDTRSGTLLGFYVNSTAGGTAISGTITPLIGWHRFPAYCDGGCHATIAVAGLNVTFVYRAA